MDPTPAVPREVATARLRLVASDATLAAAAEAYYARNRAHFAPWDPPRAPDHAAPGFHAARLDEQQRQFEAGTGWTWWLLPSGADTSLVIGRVMPSNIVRGPFHSANLGYAIDAAQQGRGLMHEALSAVIATAFGWPANLHRIQAAVRPENHRSLALLQRLGFRDEGLAREYLYTGGAWRDHRIFARVNAAFVAPAHW